MIGIPVLLMRKRDYFLAIIQEKWLWSQVFVMAMLTLCMVYSLSAALMSAPNPSYIAAIGLLSVVWLEIYHKIVKTPEDTSMLASFLFVVGAMGIAFLE